MQSEHNPLICRYFREARLSGKELAKRCSISHSRIYVARTQCVRSNNAERISRGMAHIPDISEEVRLELKDVEIFSGEMRFFRKREPADPFAAFSEGYGARLPAVEPEEAPPEPEDEPAKHEPESAGPLWAHSALGVGLGASQKEISAAYRSLTYRENPTPEHPAISQDCVNLEKVWKCITHLGCGRGQGFESTIAHHAARIPPARCVELPSQLPVFSHPPLPRKVHKWPPSRYPTVNNWR
jgi:hypothetical protein